MRTRFFVTALLALLLLCGGGNFALAQKDEDSSRRWLTVEVTDEQGEPLKSACVVLVPKKGEILLLNADKRGRVKFKKPAAGRYRVTAKSEGYELQGKEVTVGSENGTVAFSLRPRAN
jgi:Carboxypeptidase regulatory-like domain